MSAVQFTIGQNEHVRFNLPSKEQGNSSILVGKIRVRVRSLSASVDVEFERQDLNQFLGDMAVAAQSSRGTFSIESRSGSFQLLGKMAPQGHARLTTRLVNTDHPQRDEPDWRIEAGFACPAACIEQAAKQGTTF